MSSISTVPAIAELPNNTLLGPDIIVKSWNVGSSVPKSNQPPPGSFTGIRLSCSIAQGLSYSLDLPLVAISSLLSMALQLNKSQNVDKICCLVNAHMNQIYVGKYEYSSGILDVSSETVINNSDFSFENLGLDDSYSFLGDGCSLVEIQPTEFVYPNSIAILELALKEFKQGNCVNPEELKPVYLSGEEHWSKA